MAPASKDRNVGYATEGKTGPGTVKYSYATLAEVWSSCRKPLADNALCVIQQVEQHNPGSITVNTILGHSSGQSISSELSMPVIGGTAQSVGSAISYARRYGLMALVGIATDDDDDGQAATVQPGQRPPPPHIGPKITPEAAPQAAPLVAVAPAKDLPPMSDDASLRTESAPKNAWSVNVGQLKYFWQEAKGYGYVNATGGSDPDRVHAVLGVDSIKQYFGTMSAALDVLKEAAKAK
jgi:hypothetical protein